ncbi:hypothetical protein F5Y10DRAFT_238005 [Nemania abortiva]|nr:hypothetical protein F5Y10DRAFT_238005 [Nemania abortiva]
MLARLLILIVASFGVHPDCPASQLSTAGLLSFVSLGRGVALLLAPKARLEGEGARDTEPSHLLMQIRYVCTTSTKQYI